MLNSMTSYNLNSFIPQDWRGWNDYTNRLSRYEVYEGYYHNIAYHSIVTYSQGLKTTERLYKHVRGVYNPVNRLVEGYVAKVYGGRLDTLKGQSGAIPLASDNPAVIEAIAGVLWVASQWGQKKSLYTRYGAKCGDTFIKIVDDIHKRHVRLEVVDPAKVKLIEKDPDGTITRAEFEYYVRGNTQTRVLYKETITPDTFTTTTQGGDFIFYHRNGRNEPVAKWDNPYGVVPLIHVQHTDVGLNFGAPAFHGDLHKINELNDLASILNDGMRTQVKMPLFTINAAVGVLDLGSDQSTNTSDTADTPRKDTLPVINVRGENADIKALPPSLSIADGLQNIMNIESELERDMPELALHRLRESGNLTAPGVRSAFDDAIAKYQEARSNYDTGLVEAQKLALAIGGMRGYEGYRGFSLMSLSDGSLDHQIQDRPVIKDSLSLSEKIDKTIAAMSATAPKDLYIEIGWSEKQAGTFVEASQDSRNSFLMTNPFGEATTTPAVNDPAATPQDAFETRLNSGVNEGDLLTANDLLAEAV